jgi:hypothetical protein
VGLVPHGRVPAAAAMDVRVLDVGLIAHGRPLDLRGSPRLRWCDCAALPRIQSKPRAHALMSSDRASASFCRIECALVPQRAALRPAAPHTTPG